MKSEELRAKWEAGVDTTNAAWLDTMWDNLPVDLKDYAGLDPEAGLADLVRTSNEVQLPMLRADSEHSQSKRPGRSESLEVKPSLRPEEAARARAFEEYLDYAANFDQDLHRFRERVLGNDLLTAEQARAFVQSPAARFFGDHRFEFGGGNIPLTDHRATLESYERERDDQKVWHRATVSVNPPGIIETAEKWTQEPLRKVIRGPGNMDGGDGKPLSFVNAEDRVHTLWVWKWSPLEKLRRVSEKLAERYLWQGAQATMFVLTGEIPAHPPLRVSYERKGAGVGSKAVKVSQGVVTLEIAPWVSAKTVDRAYRSAQRRILRRDNRLMGEKNLKLFRFVTARLEPTGLFEDGEPQFPPGEE